MVNGALYGHGDYELNSPVSHLQCTKIIWQTKIQKEKDTHGLKSKTLLPNRLPQRMEPLPSHRETIVHVNRDKENVRNAKTFSSKKSKLSDLNITETCKVLGLP